jgi:hypothetical protein
VTEKTPLTWTSPDGLQETTFRVALDGTCRYRVKQWYDVAPDDPHGRPPGFWIPFWESGVFESLEEAQRNFKGWPVVKDEN